MFQWYQNAYCCIVYLVDVPPPATGETWRSFQSSSWFSRGWALQELLAPDDVFFCDSEWTILGAIGDMFTNFLFTGLLHEVQSASGIPADVLSGQRDPWTCSIAERMSWAAGRETSRPEDEAYCLLGIFDVNMPLLYGEGRKAFARLQKELISRSNDQSIFAWTDVLPWPVFRPLLAPSPRDFRHSGGVTKHRVALPYTITNRGVQLQTTSVSVSATLMKPLLRQLGYSCIISGEIVVIPLNCSISVGHGRKPVPVKIALARSPGNLPDQWRRVFMAALSGPGFERLISMGELQQEETFSVDLE